MTVAIFLGSLLIAMAIGIPIAYSLLISGIALMWHLDLFDAQILAQNVINGADSFPLLAIPFFVFSGELMLHGGIAEKIVNFARNLMGHWKGGLGMANVVACTLLCLLFPVAAPLFFSLFVGVAVRESGLENFSNLLSETFLYGATFFLGLTLGVLCEANTLLEPTVLKLLLLGILALFVSAVGGIIGGYVMYFATGGKFNPVIGIAGVSCVPTTAKIVQKIATAANPGAIILPQALGANISGVITSAIIAATFISFLR